MLCFQVMTFNLKLGDTKTVKKLILRGANKKAVRVNDNITPYQIAKCQNNTEMMELLQTLSCYRKYICLDNEISYFKPKKKNYGLSMATIGMVFLKSIFMVFNLIYVSKCNLSNCVKCLGNTQSTNANNIT